MIYSMNAGIGIITGCLIKFWRNKKMEERQKIVYNYLIENGINKIIALEKSKIFYFKSECDEFINNRAK